MLAPVLDIIALLCGLDAVFVALLAGPQRESAIASGCLLACGFVSLAGARFAS